MDKFSVITLYRYISTSDSTKHVAVFMWCILGFASPGKLMSPVETASCRG